MLLGRRDVNLFLREVFGDQRCQVAHIVMKVVHSGSPLGGMHSHQYDVNPPVLEVCSQNTELWNVIWVRKASLQHKQSTSGRYPSGQGYA